MVTFYTRLGGVFTALWLSLSALLVLLLQHRSLHFSDVKTIIAFGRGLLFPFYLSQRL